MMINAAKFLILLALVSACAQTQPLRNTQEWTLAPAQPDQALALDEQFLQKSQTSQQGSMSTKIAKRSYLTP